MPRPTKCRRVCQMPVRNEFVPIGNEQSEPILLTVDEYECIRLIDHEGLLQEQCAEFMQVSRATAQLIYNSARKKIATALVEGRRLHIGGGIFKICDGTHHCHCGGCKKDFGCRRGCHE